MELLPPATDTTASAPPAEPAGNAFDVDADVASLRSTSKQDYRSSWQEPEPPPETKDTPPAGSPTPAPEAPPEPEDRAKASAREFMEVYDTLQAQGFAIYSDGMKAEKFALDKFAKDRAIHHLAKGLEKMGSPELPWWAGLLVVLTPPSLVNYLTARESRAAAAAKKSAENRKRSANGEPLSPDTITDRNGMHVVPKPERTGPSAAATEAAPTAAPPRATGPMPLCQECGINPVKSRKRKYCSQHCAGVATTKKNAEKQTPTP